MKYIAIIPARSGSKSLKDKNIKLLNSKPLMSYTIEAAVASGIFDKVFVSTDSPDYAKIAIKYGADASFLRSEKTSSDTASSWDAVREVINNFEDGGEYFDRIMLLQPTSPLRNAEDIKNTVLLMAEKDADSIISVTETEHSPLLNVELPPDNCLDNYMRSSYVDAPRQQLQKYYRINGAVYLLKRSELSKNPMFTDKSYAYIMPTERSVDIDSEWDFITAESYLNYMLSQKN